MAKNSKLRKASKNILVPTVRWREVHPMGVVCRSDAYYAKMAGRMAGMIRDMIGNAVEATEDDIVDVAVELAAYLEDKINGINLWNAFMALYREKFGRSILSMMSERMNCLTMNRICLMYASSCGALSTGFLPLRCSTL